MMGQTDRQDQLIKDVSLGKCPQYIKITICSVIYPLLLLDVPSHIILDDSYSSIDANFLLSRYYFVVFFFLLMQGFDVLKHTVSTFPIFPPYFLHEIICQIANGYVNNCGSLRSTLFFEIKLFRTEKSCPAIPGISLHTMYTTPAAVARV